MNLSKLGYTEKWVKYNLLDEAIFNNQLKEFDNGEDKNAANFRLHTFLNWLKSKSSISIKEINNYLELAKEDKDDLMAGSAVRELFTSSMISDDQFELLKSKLPEFGDWTKKLIQREDLTRRLKNEQLTKELYNECLEYKKEFNDNRLLVTIISQTDNPEILSDFASNGSGKRIRTLAEKKLNKTKRESQKDK